MLHPPVQSWQQNVGLSRWRSPRWRTWRPLAQWRKTEGFLDRKIRTERGVWWMELCQGSWVDCYYRTVTSMEVVSYAGEVMVQKQKKHTGKNKTFHHTSLPHTPLLPCTSSPVHSWARKPWSKISSSVVPGLPGPLSHSSSTGAPSLGPKGSLTSSTNKPLDCWTINYMATIYIDLTTLPLPTCTIYLNYLE